MTFFSDDDALARACRQIERARREPAWQPRVQAHFDPVTCSVSYLVSDPSGGGCAAIDSVLDFDAAACRMTTASADALLAEIRAQGKTPSWLLETHVHADHLSAAPYLQRQAGGKIGIGDGIKRVQRTFGRLFNAEPSFGAEGDEFDHLFADGDTFSIGSLPVIVLHVPGHTPACVAYVIGDAVFPGDTLFMPDYGTARCDFPGGDARTLYRSIRRLLALPPQTRMFLCHDYLTKTRATHAWQTTVGIQRSENLHIHDGIDETAFVAMREQRDATLATPRLLLPSVQVNMRAGRLPPPEHDGVHYLKLPVNVF